MTKTEWWDELPTIEAPDDALDTLFQRYDELLLKGAFDQADEELGKVDLDKIDNTSILYGIAAAASWYEARPFLKETLDRVEKRLLEVTEDPLRVERILKNLKKKARLNRG